MAKTSVRMFARLREVKIARDGGMTAECIMLREGPGNAVDGHYYTADLIKRVVANEVFEGAQSFADHQDDASERATGGVRSIKDLIGWWSDVHVESIAGKTCMIGTFNVEAGNTFAQNKLREAKRFAEKYGNDPAKQYVGFSITGSGSSERQDVNGKTVNVVLDITEAGSTDMVTRAGAGGQLVSLTESLRRAAKKRARKTARSQQFAGLAESLHRAARKHARITERSRLFEVSGTETLGRPLRENRVRRSGLLTVSGLEESGRRRGVREDDGDTDQFVAIMAKLGIPLTPQQERALRKQGMVS